MRCVGSGCARRVRDVILPEYGKKSDTRGRERAEMKKPTPAMCSEGVPDNRSLPPDTRRSSDEVDLVSWMAIMSIALFFTKSASASCLPWPTRVPILKVTTCNWLRSGRQVTRRGGRSKKGMFGHRT